MPPAEPGTPTIGQFILDLINSGPRMYTTDGHCPEGNDSCHHSYSHHADDALANLENVPVWCTTCEGRGRSTYRGDAHEGYDDPDYEADCAICGGEGTLPASMFSLTSDPRQPDYEDDPEYHDNV